MLEPGKSFEEHIIVHMGMLRKFPVKIIWKDVDGEQYEKEQIISF